MIVKKLEVLNGEKLLLVIQVNNSNKNFVAELSREDGTISLPGELELLMMRPEFNLHKKFGEILTNFISETPVSLPIDLMTTSKNFVTCIN